MAGGVGYNAWKLVFEVSPIFLQGGIASFMPTAQMLPIIALTEAVNFTLGILTAPKEINLDNVFAHFAPLPNSSMIAQQIAKYPFANQQVAANAGITQPLNISYQMTCPARGEVGYLAKLPTMMMFQK